MEEQQNQHLTNRERKEILREEREKERSRERDSAARTRTVKKILWWSGGILIVAGIGYGLVYVSRQAEKARPGIAVPIQGQTHIAVGADHPPYNSNPPTSGWHYPQPAQWGAYREELPDEQLIHNLEHGGVWISYKGVDNATIAALEKIARSQFKVIVEPRSKNDAPIVLASWGRLLKLETFDGRTILDFIKANRNKSPEPNAS